MSIENGGSILKPGDYCVIRICNANSEILKGNLVCSTTLESYSKNNSFEFISQNGWFVTLCLYSASNLINCETGEKKESNC